MDRADRKMFAPLFSSNARTPEAEVYAVLGACQAGAATAAALADRLLRSRTAIGLQGPVTRRVQELLADLERAARVERIPDGRYRVVKTKR
jgi:hypothetical protein